MYHIRKRSSCCLAAYIALKSLDHFFPFVFIFFLSRGDIENEAPLEALAGQAHASPSVSKAISNAQAFLHKHSLGFFVQHKSYTGIIEPGLNLRNYTNPK